MKYLSKPIVYEVSFSKEGINKLKNISNFQINNLLLQYPTVYIIYNSTNNISVYVGETIDIQRRTIEHLDTDSSERLDWLSFSEKKGTKMIVIGHEHFNKSLTLDIENKMMLYLSGIKNIKHLNNRRTNPQNKYFTFEERDPIFHQIWSKLNTIDNNIFPFEKEIKNSALFKASPFHKLTDEQINARDKIFNRVISTLNNPKKTQLVLVSGEAGAGKTVLLSSLFYELVNSIDSNGMPKKEKNQHLDAYLLVNHDQQLKVYRDIMFKLGIANKDSDTVVKPTHFINTHRDKKKVDLILVDEAHLLWTQGKQSYTGHNQLYDLLNMAKVVIAVFDHHQILTTTGYWENLEYKKLVNFAKDNGTLITLHNQMRMQADSFTVNWINDFVHNHKVNPVPKNDTQGYKLKIFSNPDSMYQEIIYLSKNKSNGLTRLLATFDWPYIDKKKPDNDDYWRVKIGNWSLPWNLQIQPNSKIQKRKNKYLAWAEQPQTINEVGSTFTIQGFDLNYAGVIIGPSVKYRNGKLIFDPKASCNKKATQKRTFADKTKQNVAEELLENELNVLMTRGVHGLYIYAVDSKLREKLLNS
ncbi:ATP-dependent exonuclease [Bombilactobacillus bombi]|uniref:ATP-dependent exonuclease n=1 Tax=Bombilactobacillus bombi TaxID=1303590 RepID=A0A417ZE55_9LACO|nr:DNA/RNA helicase domain-containing protein [Bombilactobacillus bombi]RHW49559.1 ATP-dependent exonuclease [Bombilactobacillus bombi]